MILPISQNKINQSSYLPQKKVEGRTNSVILEQNAPRSSNQTGFFPPFLGTPETYARQIQALKTEMEAFPKDIDYRKTLMTNAGKDPNEYYKIRSIVGVSEIKSIMKDFNDSEEFYSVGVDDKNIKNKTIRANLHIHTLASDGYLSTQELLSKAAAYADEVAKNLKPEKGQVAEPFIVAITDHDTTESAKEAIDIISKNPLKYKNLRVALGIELTTYNNIATDFMTRPTDNHILAYGIDPNEKTFSKFIKDKKHYKHRIASKMVNQANKTYKESFNSKNNLFSLEEASNFYNPLKKDILGIHNYVESYINTKIILDEIVLKNPSLRKKIEKRKLPLQADKLMLEVKDFYYKIDKNNKPRKSIEIVSQFLGQKLNMQKSEIEEIIQATPKSEELNSFLSNSKKELEPYKITLDAKYHYMPTIEDVFNSLKNQDGAIVGIAHPLDPTKRIPNTDQKYEYLAELYNKFKQAGGEKAGFSEVYYQSYDEKLKALKAEDKTKELLNKVSEELDLFKTGSADSHRRNIFKRFD